MKMVILSGDRVRVTKLIKGYERGYYAGTVLSWTNSGKLKIKADNGPVAVVSSELVKKIADGSNVILKCDTSNSSTENEKNA